MPLSRQELADIVGTSRETITRELKKMEREGMLKIDRRLITIADRERFADLGAVASEFAIEVPLSAPMPWLTADPRVSDEAHIRR